jgi:hypothetical protein
MPNRILAGYVAPNDSGKYELIVDHDGPASYNNTGTFTTSGEQVNASDFGLGGFETVGVDSLASDGASVVEVCLGCTVAGATFATGAGSSSQVPGPVATTAVLHWFTGVTRSTEVANATNLSARSVRLRIVGV